MPDWLLIISIRIKIVRDIFHSIIVKHKTEFARFSYALIIIAFAFLTSCVGTRFLKEGEQILYSQSLEGAKGLDTEEIESLYANKPNKRVIFMPLSPQIGMYRRGISRFDLDKYKQKKGDTQEKYNLKISKYATNEKKQKRYREKLGKKTDKLNRIIKEGNFGMRNGEPLAVFDNLLEENTTSKIKAYLQSIGYFNAKVSYATSNNEDNKLVDVIYSIEKKEPYIIDSIFFVIPDSLLLSVYQKSNALSLIKKGEAYQQRNLVAERERINNLLLNNGYYDFSRQYLSFAVDTAIIGDKKVAIGINIKNPKSKNEHKIFKLDSVIFTTDADITALSTQRNSLKFNRVNYQFHYERYSKKVVDWRLFLYPDSTYSKEKTFETQRQLSNLDIFKFINVNYDTTGGKFIANIFTSPLKKFQTGTELGINVSEGLPGPFVNFNFKDRNIFKGLEVMELNVRVGYEGLGGVSSQGNAYSSLEYGGNIIFTFPQFLFPFSTTLKSRMGNLNPQTKLVYGLSLTDRPEYLRKNINTSITYTWQKKQTRIFNFTLAEISFIDSDLTSDFENLLLEFQKNGNNLLNSFQPSFVSSSMFSAQYNFNDYGNGNKKSSYIRYSVEAGGTIFNVFSTSLFGSSLQYYQFAKVNTDYRSTKPLNSKVSIAYRVNLGVAIPYGVNKTLPYEKFFFAGGSNSLRAWSPRRLGPGSYSPIDENGNYNDSFEQSGEIVFESSIEFRHKIFGFFYGAFFADVGNVWTLRNDDTRPGSQFELNRFYKEIAVGAGYGFRFDFSFLLLRFDAGFKIYDPTGLEGKKYIWDAGFSEASYSNYKKLIWNIGIGYPF